MFAGEGQGGTLPRRALSLSPPPTSLSLGIGSPQPSSSPHPFVLLTECFFPPAGRAQGRAGRASSLPLALPPSPASTLGPLAPNDPPVPPSSPHQRCCVALTGQLVQTSSVPFQLAPRQNQTCSLVWRASACVCVSVFFFLLLLPEMLCCVAKHSFDSHLSHVLALSPVISASAGHGFVGTVDLAPARSEKKRDERPDPSSRLQSDGFDGGFGAELSSALRLEPAVEDVGATSDAPRKRLFIPHRQL